MTDCATIRTWILEEDERSLSSSDAAALRAHLAGCTSCAAAAAAQNRLWDALRVWGDLEPSPGFAARVRKAVFRPRLRLVPYLPVAAAAAAAVLILLPVLRPSDRSSLAPITTPEGELALASPDEEVIAHLDVLEHMDVAEGIDLVEARSRLAEIHGILDAGEGR